MQTRMLISSLGTLLVAATGAWLAQGCKSVDCGEGTVERDGACVPADQTVGTATCGPFTELQGTTCVPMFPPTVCDPATTDPDPDPDTGVTTCKGHGGGGCGGSLACPAPAAGKQSICGQLYNFEDMSPFQAQNATGAQCTAGATTGPCALGIRAYDAIAFATDPAHATPLTTGTVYIDDCGRYRVPDITVPSGPFVGLGIDDADLGTGMGPAGITNAVGVATSKSPNASTKDFEAYVVPTSTTDKWAATGGPTLTTGFAVGVFRAHKTGQQTQASVAITRQGTSIPANDFYFKSTDTTYSMIDDAATVSGMNGGALLINATATEGIVYTGTGGGLPAECTWELHAMASLPGIVFIQLFRPTNVVGQTCTL